MVFVNNEVIMMYDDEVKWHYDGYKTNDEKWWVTYLFLITCKMTNNYDVKMMCCLCVF